LAVAPRTLLYTLCLWLSFATVLGHALVPVGSPLAKRAGSAFSTSTSDVSLGPSRAGTLAKIKRLQDRVGEESVFAGDAPAPILRSDAFATLSPPTNSDIALAVPDGPAPTFSPGHGFDARAPPRA